MSIDAIDGDERRHWRIEIRRDARSARYAFQVASSTASGSSIFALVAAASYPSLMISSALSKLSALYFCSGTEISRSALSMLFSSLAEIMTEIDWPNTPNDDRLAFAARGASARWTARVMSAPMFFATSTGMFCNRPPSA